MVSFFNVVGRRRRARQERNFAALRARIVTEENRRAGLFDADWYRAANPDVANEGIDPFLHYVRFGHKEMRDPGPNFDNAFYKNRYPDVVAAGLVPLVHYLDNGRAEGRYPHLRVIPAAQSVAVRHVIVKAAVIEPGQGVALLVTHAPAGRLKPHVLPYMRLLADSGLAVMLVAVVDRPLELLDTEVEAAAGVIVRENAGYDFAAWAHAFEIEPALYGAGLLVMTNDSVIPTADKAVFGTMMARVRACPADIVALTASHEYGWHVQSYFQALKPKALSSWAFQHWMRAIKRFDDKDVVIRTYEVTFAARMQAAGFSVEAIYAGSNPANPTFFSWRELIGQGFPFVKLLMLRKGFAATVPDWPDIVEDIQVNWPEVLGEAGFDVDLVRAAVLAAELSGVPAGDSGNLLVAPERFAGIEGARPLRVAFIGPWNYDIGLGVASREIIAALRRTGARLNLHPIERPFHIHRPICPAVAVTDFGGQADVAVVHLNPDSWGILTPEQREVVDSARMRIGYWVWETDTVPPFWAPDLKSVDRIWAPSRYCAEVFEKQIGLPVDVVPHVVPVADAAAGDRGAALARFGLAADARVILYVFDGASYLVRKNPHGLIRAFSASGLAARGWTLLLKTKHLYDRPEAGAELAVLAASTPGVCLAEAALAAGEMAALMAAADIYASPHASEGFGLTVAEAMAAGKPVVATDFSGTRDFLDASCGHPVAWEHSVLTEDHGHYLKGHGWAKIDEDALSAALTRAADAVERGEDAVGHAARARIARDLSVDSVAAAIRTSIAAALSAKDGGEGVELAVRPKPPAPPRPAEVRLAQGLAVAHLAVEDGIVPVCLAADLSYDGAPLPAGKPTDWLLFVPIDARVAPGIAHFVRAAAAARPDASAFYGDDVCTGGEPLDRIRLKPDFDRTLICAQDYIGAPLAVRRDALDAIGGPDRTRGTAVLFDLVLRLAAAGRVVTRIPHVLVGWTGERPVALLADRCAALRAAGLPLGGQLVAGLAPGLLAMRWRFTAADAPRVAICIPTRRTPRAAGSGETWIEALLAGIAAVDWPMERLTVIVGDDGHGTPAWAKRRWPFTLVHVDTQRPVAEPFHYAAKMNRLWQRSDADIIVFMNDDLTPHGPDWLHALAGFAREESVGGVGARLLYEDGLLQHAGIVPAFDTVVHAWLAMDPAAHTYQDWALAQREWSMVTGAVFAARRAVLEQVGGFDEAFSLEFNDIDLCLRIRNLGYRIVCNPDATFTHAEKASRGETPAPGGEVALFLTRWSRWLERDPAAHPGFARERVDLVPVVAAGAWYQT